MINCMNKVLAVSRSSKDFHKCNISTSQWNLRGKRFLKQVVSPGVGKRLSIVDNDDLEEVDPDDLEADLMKAGKMYGRHESEMEVLKERQKLEIVKRKYFKPEQQPNFLTWTEKEQIRHLHRSDPAEWTTGKLARSFPASEIIIKKIIKSEWKPENEKKILAHDKSVESNWKALKHGKLNINVQHKSHILNFSKRERATLAHANPNDVGPLRIVDSSTASTTGDFLNIIKTYTDSMGKTCPQKEVQIPTKRPKAHTSAKKPDTYLIHDDIEQNKNNALPLLTLEKYRETVAHHSDNTLPDQSCKPKNSIRKNPEDFAITKSNLKDKVLPQFKAEKNANFYSYEEHISIPRNKWKEGGTYKVGECYYDDDGELLYRVPGMK